MVSKPIKPRVRPIQLHYATPEDYRKAVWQVGTFHRAVKAVIGPPGAPPETAEAVLDPSPNLGGVPLSDPIEPDGARLW